MPRVQALYLEAVKNCPFLFPCIEPFLGSHGEKDQECGSKMPMRGIHGTISLENYDRNETYKPAFKKLHYKGKEA